MRLFDKECPSVTDGEGGRHARLRVDRAASPACTLDAADRDFRLGFFRAEADDPAGLKIALSLGPTRCLRKPFGPSTLRGLIDECLSEAGPHAKACCC